MPPGALPFLQAPVCTPSTTTLESNHHSGAPPSGHGVGTGVGEDVGAGVISEAKKVPSEDEGALEFFCDAEVGGVVRGAEIGELVGWG